MEHYQVIARKYRPKNFSDVIGQEAIVHTLLQAIKKNRVAHAYLFCGLRGTGKTSIARLFAKTLNCATPTETGEPCNRCTSCTELNNGYSLDVIEIDGASNRGIDDIRQITESAIYTPANGRYKIYIIDEVHMLTKEASNALLKTLEEPPKGVKFFFATTEPHKILPTILSRCQRFDLSRISDQALVEALRKISSDFSSVVDESALHLIARLSEGSLRDAQTLLDQALLSCSSPINEESLTEYLGLPSKSCFFAIDQAILKSDIPAAFTLSEQIFSQGHDLTFFLETLSHHFRTLLVYKMKGREPTLTQSIEATYKEEAALFTQEHLLYILDYLVKWLSQLQKGTAKRFELEMILLHLIRSQNRISIESLYRRLTELEQGIKKPAEDSPASHPKAQELTQNTYAESKESDAPAPTQIPETSLENLLPEIEPQKAQESPIETAEAPPSKIAEGSTPFSYGIAQEEEPQRIQGNLFETIASQASPPILNTTPATQEKESARPNLAPQPSVKDRAADIRYETLLRFAAVELNGSVHKEQVK